jgi:P27 family predicted phage terminase small subunit
VRAIFDRVARDLDSMGLASTVDADNLATYCQALYEHSRASVLISKQGIISIGDHGQPVRNPACVITQQTSATILRFAREFGLTPSSRTAMGSTKEPEDGKDSARLLA